MWNVLKSEMRMPVFAAAACAAVMLVASPVSAATDLVARQAQADLRDSCSRMSGQVKAGCLGTRVRDSRVMARQAYQDCIDAGGLRDDCKADANQVWVDRRNLFLN